MAGELAKALTLPGSEANRPVGLAEASGFPFVLLIEGGPDLLSAIHLAILVGIQDRVAPVAMLGAGCSIPPDCTGAFEGKRVRVFPHADRAGRGAWERWAVQLLRAGAEVDGYDFDDLSMPQGEPVGDLNDFCVLVGAGGRPATDIATSALDFTSPGRKGGADGC
jgi:hypothetical protein